MNIPQIEFRYSWIYDEFFKDLYKGKDKYPSGKNIEKFMTHLQKLWYKHEQEIVTTLAKITNLLWEEEKIICYVVGRTLAFSDPLTIPAYVGYEDYAIDVITHELIHRLFTQPKNYNKMKPFWSQQEKKYKKEAYNTMLHIPVEAVHTAFYKQLFDDKRLKRDKDFLSLMPDYKIAWDIVEKEGYEKIISDILEKKK